MSFRWMESQSVLLLTLCFVGSNALGGITIDGILVRSATLANANNGCPPPVSIVKNQRGGIDSLVQCTSSAVDTNRRSNCSATTAGPASSQAQLQGVRLGVGDYRFVGSTQAQSTLSICEAQGWIENIVRFTVDQAGGSFSFPVVHETFAFTPFASVSLQYLIMRLVPDGWQIISGFAEGQVVILPAGTYQVLVVMIPQASNADASASGSYEVRVVFENATEVQGLHQAIPILPDAIAPPSPIGGPPGAEWHWILGVGWWYDPPVAKAFLFQTVGGGLFTNIMGLPTGFAQPFEIVVNGQSLGFFSPPQTVNLAELTDSPGVTSFEVRGISPCVSSDNPVAFPIQLQFSADTGVFQMFPIVHPGDVNCDDVVNVDDLLGVINGWGPCRPAPAICPADIAPLTAPNHIVNVDDLLAVINNWG